MRKVLSVVIIIALCAFALVMDVQAKEKGKGEKIAKRDIVEKSGLIEVKAPEKGQKYGTVLLKVGEEAFKLIPAKTAKGIMKKLEALAGKDVTVNGTLLPASDKFPLAAISVTEFSEGKPAAPAVVPVTPAATPATPAKEHSHSEHPHGH